MPVRTAASDADQLGGLTGFVMDVVAALGAWGVGLLTALEVVFPPIPSEVVLPLAGYLVHRERLELLPVFLAATAGSVLGALLLYALGARLGAERAAVLLARLPLVDVADVARATAWFERHGRSAVLVGRLVPGVRSLVSLPAGASRMPVIAFLIYTLVGSAAWNALLVGAGVALGTQWRLVERYSGVLDVVAVAVIGGLLALAVRRHLRRRRRDAHHTDTTKRSTSATVRRS